MIILFDLDGTLINSTDAIVDSFFDVFNFFSLDKPKREDIVSLIGYPLDDMFSKLGANKDIEDYVLKYKEFYRPRSIPKTTLLPLAKVAIVEASKIAKLGIVTTKISERTHALLTNLGVNEYFEIIIGRDNVQNPKPHPEPVLKALKHFKNVDKANTFMIGDTFMDIEAANASGINSIGVLCGSGTKQSFLECNAKHICNTTFDAIQLIKDNYATS